MTTVSHDTPPIMTKTVTTHSVHRHIHPQRTTVITDGVVMSVAMKLYDRVVMSLRSGLPCGGHVDYQCGPEIMIAFVRGARPWSSVVTDMTHDRGHE